MIQCNKTEQMLADRFLGLLTPEQENELQGHLEQCTYCRTLAGKYTAAAQALRESPEIKPDPYLANRVVEQAKSLTHRKTLLGRWWLPALAGAAGLVCVAVITPHLGLMSAKMSNTEVFESYSEDIQSLGFWEEGETTDDFTFKYENYGVPDAVSEYMI